MFEIISQFFQNQSQKNEIREKYLLFQGAKQPFISQKFHLLFTISAGQFFGSKKTILHNYELLNKM